MKKDISRRDFLKTAAVGTIGFMAAGVVGCSASETPSAAQQEPAPQPAEQPVASKYSAGTYGAVVQGYSSFITVTMTFSADAITACDIDASGETPGIGDVVATEYSAGVVKDQSVDVVTSATAGYTIPAIRRAVENCVAQAEGKAAPLNEKAGGGAVAASADWLGEEPEIADSEIVETVECDVLVVGDGTGGAFAAAAAAEEGAKVLIIEKGAAGYGLRGDFGALNSKLAKGAGIEYDKFEVIEDICRYAAYDCDMELVKLWADKSGEALDWYQEVMAKYGITEYLQTHNGTPGGRHAHWATGHNNTGGMMAPPGEGATDKLREYILSLGGEYRNETPMIKLIKENDRVVGAIAKNASGYIRINAAKGVIVATGGYARNDDMMRILQPHTCKHYAWHESPPTHVGDGIKAMVWAGGELQSIHGSMLFDRCSLPPDGVSGLDNIDKGCLFWMGSQPYMKVDLNGVRFVNESCPYDFVLHASASRPGNCYCTIWDSNYLEHMRQFDTLGCSRVYPIKAWDGEKEFEADGSLDSMIAMSMGMSMEAGNIQQADTFEELAKKLNIPADAFVEQAELYNKMCDEGVDSQFGKEAYRMIKLDKPPYFGTRQTGMLLCTLDGVYINTKMEVLDKDRKPIPGLYAVGNDSGGFYGNTYPNYSTGNAAGRTVTFGRIAGKVVCGKEL